MAQSPRYRGVGFSAENNECWRTVHLWGEGGTKYLNINVFGGIKYFFVKTKSRKTNAVQKERPCMCVRENEIIEVCWTCVKTAGE